MNEDAKDAIKPPSSSFKTIIFGLLIIGITFFGAGIWAATAPLASAVAASGVIVNVGRQRVIDHLEGGIISSISVREGDNVEAGQPLFKLDTTSLEANVERLWTQLANQLAVRDRLNAEYGSDEQVIFDQRLRDNNETPTIKRIMAVQVSEFIERGKSLKGTIELLERRIEQLNSAVEGFTAQRDSRQQQVDIITEELVILNKLAKQKLVGMSRLLALKREKARIFGEIGNNIAQIAQSKEQIGETKLQIIQTHQEARQEVISLITQTEARIADIEQQLLVARDTLKRSIIIAPISGIIQNLAITTVGGVISPNEVLAEIAPNSAELLIEAQVSPLDIDKVSLQQEAEVRFSSLDLRKTPSIYGEVITRSGDRIVDSTGRQEFFRVQISTSPEELEKLNDQQLQAGMPAEVFFKTKDRTFLNYLAKPLIDAVSQGLKEE